MKFLRILFFLLLTTNENLYSQGSPPWENPLLTCISYDGINFSPPVIFQDSSGVPCIIRWKGDTLICAFQWFRGPLGSPTWDRVAVKFSYDDGQHWTAPVPIAINNFPPSFQRPFDPALVRFANDSLRIYFSSSDGVSAGLDSLVNTYSAVSTDGIHYTFEAGARADHPASRLIDPSVIYFNHSWHYLSPSGAPQDGAFHFISPDGLQFNQVQDIHSDSLHNWTGNYLVVDSSEMRFYGCGENGIWFNTTPNGGVWTGYTASNIRGGDPSVVQLLNNSFQIVFTGGTGPTFVTETGGESEYFKIYPNPAVTDFCITNAGSKEYLSGYQLFDCTGQFIEKGIFYGETRVSTANLENGFYIIALNTGESVHFHSLIIFK
ncbi:MAG TPA: T9SS type A sorting domain-containing protein [Bacteroidia bacterium]|nr:T9SS type A sorting domain-containing protein [Bacteroidia bacterium]